MTIGTGTPTGTGYVVNFDKNDNTTGANTRLVKNNKTLNDTYKVITTDNSTVASTNIPSNIPTYGTALAAPLSTGAEAVRDDEYIFNGWKVGDTNTAFTTVGTVVNNNYMVKASWKEVIYTFKVYDSDNANALLKTISNVKMNTATWGDIISGASTAKSGYDLLSANTAISGTEQRYGAVTVRYDTSGNRYINDTSTISTYLESAITDGVNTKVNLGDRTDVNLYTSWQAQNINLTVSYTLSNEMFKLRQFFCYKRWKLGNIKSRYWL